MIPLFGPKGHHRPDLIFGTLENSLVFPPKYYNSIFPITCESILGRICPEYLLQGFEQKKILLVVITNQKDFTVLAQFWVSNEENIFVPFTDLTYIELHSGCQEGNGTSRASWDDIFMKDKNVAYLYPPNIFCILK